MRRARMFTILLISIALGIGAWVLFRKSSEPKYQGKPFSYWFNEFSQLKATGSTHRYLKAEEAIRRMGTNAVPYLVEEAMNPTQDTPLRKKFHDFLEQFPKSWEVPAYVSRKNTREDAEQLIGEIKPPADLLLPQLVKALSQPNTPPYDWAISILTYAGE